MKVIQSAGGPLIGIERNDARCWRGIFGKDFVGEGSVYNSDYNSLIDAPKAIGKIHGVSSFQAILIAMPYESSIFQLEEDTAYVVQVQYAEPNWSFLDIRADDLRGADFLKHAAVSFTTKACEFVFFDSADQGKDIEDDCLSFMISSGIHELSFSIQDVDELTRLWLYRIRRVN